MANSILREWMGRTEADWNDVVAHAYEHLQQPHLDYWLDREPDYFIKERRKSVMMGHWPPLGEDYDKAHTGTVALPA
jgi:hypothetical protein